VSRANKNVIGAFQGIVPTSASLSKRVIAFTINRCRAFLVRDAESKTKLDNWGVTIPVVSSFDPAVFDVAERASTDLLQRFTEQQGVRADFLANFAGFGLRRWFHYSQSGWLPAKMRFWERKNTANSPELETYLNNLAALADATIDDHDVNLVFFPMHVSASENDPEFAKQVVARMKNPERTTVIEGDNFSPDEYLSLIGHARFFVASRLHSAILATVANVPALCLYYVDKGRLFFEQIGQQRFSRDIKEMLNPGIVEELRAQIKQLVSQAPQVKTEQVAALSHMREQIKKDFSVALAANGGMPAVKPEPKLHRA
jgi:polysaccharide pyruvyl transferase WcaK-like protein